MIELIVYIFLAALLLALATTFFRISRRQYEATSSSHLIGQEAANAIQWIKRDLQETALSTIRISLSGTPELPSMSFVGAADGKGRSFKVSRFGTPDWNRHIFYHLTEEGALHTWARPLEDLASPKRFLPVPSEADPSNQEGGESKRALLREVMLPNQEIKIDGKDAPFPKITEWGGFRPGFVVYDQAGKEHLITQNPAQITESLATSPGGSVTTFANETLDLADIRTTRLLEVQLSIKLKGFRDNSPNAIQIPLRVSPIH